MNEWKAKYTAWIIGFAILCVCATISDVATKRPTQSQHDFIVVNNSVSFIDRCGIELLTSENVEKFYQSDYFDDGKIKITLHISNVDAALLLDWLTKHDEQLQSEAEVQHE